MKTVYALKRRSTSTRIHGAISRKAVTFIFATVKTSNITTLISMELLGIRERGCGKSKQPNSKISSINRKVSARRRGKNVQLLLIHHLGTRSG
jgi:hypothetical protein